jgi:hypothetical protein|tara:strand:- start:993 stop:1121 length:129 start_codon:yes stop_codon:yes gene_type:complete
MHRGENSNLPTHATPGAIPGFESALTRLLGLLLGVVLARHSN